MIDISLLRVLSTRESFNKLYSAIPMASLEQRTQVLVKDIARYYKTFSDHESIDFIQFRDVFNMWHKNLNADQVEFYDKILSMAEKNLDDVSHAVLLNSLLELNYATKIAEILELYNSGEEINLVEEMKSAQDHVETLMERAEVNDWIKPDLDELIVDESEVTGLEWRLECMNRSLRNLVGGDAMIIAGRPGKGKTTFLTDQTTHMAPQVDDRPIIWLNNESKGERIVRRSMQSALNAKISDLVQYHKEGKLQEMYAEALGGADRFRVIDIHGYWNWQVAKIIEEHKPKVVVMDMIDNIKFAGLNLNTSRTDQILEEMYKWGRELAVEHDFVLMATSQISADGHGMQFPAESMLKDSRTGKQGATDTILMIGSSEDPVLEKSRFLSTPKTKFDREGSEPLRSEVFLDRDRGRYVEAKVK